MGNGQQPPPGPEGQAIEAALQMFGGMLVSFAPGLSDDEARGVVAAILHQQEQLGQVINDAVDPKVKLEHPRWGFRLHNRAGKVPEQMGQQICPKEFMECASLAEVLHFATTVALLTSPASRAVLAAYGYDLEFVQGGKSRSIIH